MTAPQQKNDDLLTPEPRAIENLHSFRHEAMNTFFEIFIVHPDAVYASQAAQETFVLLDRLEGDLSCFIENSEISQLNAASAGHRIRLTLPAFDCLSAAKGISELTHGAFDVTVGVLVKCWREENYSPRNPTSVELEQAQAKTGWRHVQLYDDMTACVDCPGVRIDLGAIGKGFSLDQMGEVLREWGIETAMLSSGGSTILAMDSPPNMKGWPVSISDPLNRKNVLEMLSLANVAVSCSGIEKGGHIIDPRTGRPVRDRLGAWSVASDAATADALSTAFIVMSPPEIEAFCQEHPVAAMIYLPPEKDENPGRWIRFGEF
jgi:FAD:protein FMN transferase